MGTFTTVFEYCLCSFNIHSGLDHTGTTEVPDEHIGCGQQSTESLRPVPASAALRVQSKVKDRVHEFNLSSVLHEFASDHREI